MIPRILFVATWFMVVENLPGAASLPGIERYLYLTYRNISIASLLNETHGNTGLEKRIIAENPILTFLDICKNGIGRNLPFHEGLFNIECHCSVGAFPPSFGGACESTKRRCLGAIGTGESLLCGYPEVGFHFDAVSIIEQYFPLEMFACFHENSLFGMHIPSLMPTCFNFIAPRIFDILGVFALDDSFGENEEPPASRCTVTHGDQVCETCTSCIDEAGRIGMKFDCESLQANLTSFDTCITLGDILFSYE